MNETEESVMQMHKEGGLGVQDGTSQNASISERQVPKTPVQVRKILTVDGS